MLRNISDILVNIVSYTIIILALLFFTIIPFMLFKFIGTLLFGMPVYAELFSIIMYTIYLVSFLALIMEE